MIMKEKCYESPKVEIVQIAVEQGFASSQKPSPWEDMAPWGDTENGGY